MNAKVETERLFTRALPHAQAASIRSLAKDIYLLLYLPMSLVPSVALLFAWTRHRADTWSHVPFEAVAVMAAALCLTELLLVPLLVETTHVLLGQPDPRTAHRDVEFLEAFAPSLLMVTPLLLVVPRLFVYGIGASAVAVGMMLFTGGYALGDPRDPEARGLSWLVIDLAFTGWAVIMLIVALI